MPINKVVYYGKTIIDLSNDSVSADTLLKGVTAHDKSGNKITGTYEASSSGDYEIWDGTFEGNAEIVTQTAYVENDVLYVDGVVENNTLTLSYGTVENNTLIF